MGFYVTCVYCAESHVSVPSPSFVCVHCFADLNAVPRALAVVREISSLRSLALLGPDSGLIRGTACIYMSGIRSAPARGSNEPRIIIIIVYGEDTKFGVHIDCHIAAKESLMYIEPAGLQVGDLNWGPSSSNLVTQISIRLRYIYTAHTIVSCIIRRAAAIARGTMTIARYFVILSTAFFQLKTAECLHHDDVGHGHAALGY